MGRQLNLATRMYGGGGLGLIGSYPIDGPAYDRLSGGVGPGRRINSMELYGAPTCPCCGNQFGLVTCECGGIDLSRTRG